MKLVLTATQQEAIELKLAIFNAGAPMTAVLFGNYFDEVTRGVYQDAQMKAGTFYLDSEFPYTEVEGYSWALKHIDDYQFAPYTYQYYLDTYPENEAILARIPKDEEENYDEAWLDRTPQEYVSEVIIGNNYHTITV